VSHREPETVESIPVQTIAVDDSLRGLWEKVRTAAALIQELKTERQELRVRLSAAEAELASLREVLQQRETDLRRLRSEMNSDGSRGFHEDEKEALKERIRDLISKINSHL
jgi:chromosome segregation ATPase